MNKVEQLQEKVRFLEQELNEKNTQGDFLASMLESTHRLNKLKPGNDEEIFKFAADISEKFFGKNTFYVFATSLKKRKEITYIKKIHTNAHQCQEMPTIKLDSFYNRVLDGHVSLCHNISQIPSWSRCDKYNDKMSVHLCAKGKKVAYIIVIFFNKEAYTQNSITAVHRCILFLNQFIEKLENNLTIRKQIHTIRSNRDDLLKRENIKESFFANISHEIRTPLNIILGVIQSLEEKDIEAKLRNMIFLMKSSAENLLFLINDILDLSKIQNNSFTITPRRHSIRDFANEVWESFQYRKSKYLDFSITVDSRIPDKLIFDPIRLKQVFNNLISNAFKFTRKGIINFYFTQYQITDDDVRLKMIVIDTGCGIKEESLKTILDPYTQEQTDEQLAGSGLGLHITDTMIQLMGGQVNIDSVLNVGTKITIDISFNIDLKQNDDLEDLNKKPQRLDTQQTKEYIRLLVVDDSHMNIYIFKELLSKSKVDITGAYGGYQAIDIAKEHNFDIIFMDISMPEIDGIETAKHIKSLQRHQNTPIVAFTAHATKSEIEKLTQTYFDDVLTKPVIKQKLIKVINKNTPSQEVLSNQQGTMEPTSKELHLNLALGLMTCQADKNLYRKVLLIFLDENHSFEDKVSNIFNDPHPDNLKDLEFMSHKLCGTCGNLGLEKLYKLMKDINSHLNDPELKLDQLPYNLDEVLATYQVTSERINEYLNNKHS